MGESHLILLVREEGVDGGLKAEEALEEGQRVGSQRVHGAIRGRMLYRIARDGHLELLKRRPCLPVHIASVHALGITAGYVMQHVHGQVILTSGVREAAAGIHSQKVQWLRMYGYALLVPDL